MTATLLLLAALVALDPFRAAAAAPPSERGPIAALGAGAVLVGVVLLAALSGPFLDAIAVTGSSARIAAGVALVAVSLRDLVAPPPGHEPALAGRWAALVPIAFPVLLTPAVALLAVAGAADRGVLVATAAMVPGLVLAGAAVARPPTRWVVPGLRVVAGLGVAVGAFVTLDGVYAV